eukprot:COSAG02_NODE_10101_length_2023_cov_352.244283_1_plen_202_part_00
MDGVGCRLLHSKATMLLFLHKSSVRCDNFCRAKERLVCAIAHASPNTFDRPPMCCARDLQVFAVALFEILHYPAPKWRASIGSKRWIHHACVRNGMVRAPPTLTWPRSRASTEPTENRHAWWRSRQRQRSWHWTTGDGSRGGSRECGVSVAVRSCTRCTTVRTKNTKAMKMNRTQCIRNKTVGLCVPGVKLRQLPLVCPEH